MEYFPFISKRFSFFVIIVRDADNYIRMVEEMKSKESPVQEDWGKYHKIGIGSYVTID